MSVSDATAFKLAAAQEGEITVYDTVEDEEAGNGRVVPLFQGASVALRDGETFDIGEKLDEGDGVIVVPDSEPHLTDVLRRHPALVETPVPEDRDPSIGYRDRSKTWLQDENRRRGLSTSGTKDDLADRLEANDAAVAAGDVELASDPTPETREEVVGVVSEGDGDDGSIDDDTEGEG